MASKMVPDDLVDIKVHTEFSGDTRCSLIEASMGNLYSMTYAEFCNFLQEEIPRLVKFQVLRVSFLDLENEYIELTDRNFHKFVRLATKSCGKTDSLRINIKVSEGTSPAPAKVSFYVFLKTKHRCWGGQVR